MNTTSMFYINFVFGCLHLNGNICRKYKLLPEKLKLYNLNNQLFSLLDKLFCTTDKAQIRRTKNIRLIPDYKNRKGGKLSYAEWAHVIGIFQTILFQTLKHKTQNSILDVGCGTGLLGIASEPFISDGGTYTGIDVMQEDISFCKSHFPSENYKFIHLNVANPTYASNQPNELKKWPVADKSQDLVTALSVWTHLSETDAFFYMKEVQRVLKDGGKAIITFFFLNEDYQKSLPIRQNGAGRFHSTDQNTWIFNKAAYNSKEWFTIPSAQNPEDAIGITETGIKALLDNAGLKLQQRYPGNWKEIPGVFFQDILILNK